jgi:ketosteroid isomerase-like protein
MLDLQEISDRLEIQQLMTDYSTAIDQRDFDGLDRVFTPDAYIDYRAMAGIDGRYPEIKAWLKGILPTFPNYYHMIGNSNIIVSGDFATSRTICFNPMVTEAAEGRSQTQVFFCGLWYIDRHVRTEQGWRIAKRIEESCFLHNAPAHISRLYPF